MAAWIFLGVSIWGAAFTVNALWPIRRWPLSALSFFPAWLTAELALHHLVWQAGATGVFACCGAFDSLPGWIGGGLTLLSWLGLGWLHRRAHSAGRTIREALEEGLGPGWSAGFLPLAEQPLGAISSAWRRALLPLHPDRRGVERVRDLPYVEPDDGNPRHRLDLYYRRGGVTAAPVLLQIHGGGWMIGKKEEQGLPLMQHLARLGWLCVAINYRLSPRATWPDHLVDCKLALKWIREHAAEHGGDPGLVVVTGGSAGGHLAALVALTANDPEHQPGFEDTDTSVSAFIPLYGVFDWRNRYALRAPGDPLIRGLEKHIVKRRQDEAAELYEQASPISRLRGRHIPPAMIVHGDNDTLVPVAEARRFVAALQKASTEPVVYAELPGAQHAFEVFPSVRALYTIRGIGAFAAWVADQARKS